MSLSVRRHWRCPATDGRPTPASPTRPAWCTHAVDAAELLRHLQHHRDDDGHAQLGRLQQAHHGELVVVARRLRLLLARLRLHLLHVGRHVVLAAQELQRCTPEQKYYSTNVA